MWTCKATKFNNYDRSMLLNLGKAFN
jgi:hypothetical protein